MEINLDMEKRIPKKLIVCLLKNKRGEEGWSEITAGVQKEHTKYMTDLWQKGIFWAGGPTKENISIEIYAVDTVEEAMEAQRNAPLYKTGFQYEEEYLEWTPAHWPPLRPGLDPKSGKLYVG